MENSTKKMLVTCALPYANGVIHIGHIVEYIQADIWVRLQKMRGINCTFICADDSHGTPIMISAEKQGITPEELIAKVKISHEADLAGFSVDFDNFYTTHSPENKYFAELIYNRLKEKGDINALTIEQAFDPEKNMFLPDRYVKGTCPKCGTEDQYGDNCESCGATYTPTDLINPISAISGATPIKKSSEHFFFRLENYQAMLKEWIESGHVHESVKHKLLEWFQSGLEQWDISRDAPYFGFEIPDAPGKFFYVWLDAPIGYMASFKNLCDKRDDLDFDTYWNKNSKVELYHFIGKDIVYFHALFWPAMLEGSGFRKPSKIFTHGFLTINGKKMSKSRGTNISAHDYLQKLNPEYLRYYYAAKLGPGVEDIDLNFEDFINRVNSDLVGKVVNIASRCAGFIRKGFDNKLSAALARQDLFDELANAGDKIAELYEAREYNPAVREIMALADRANQYIDEMKPWTLAKVEGEEQNVHAICTMGINLFRQLMVYLKPILPQMAKDTESFLNIEPLTWNDSKTPLLNHSINKFKPLMQRIQQETIDELLDEQS